MAEDEAQRKARADPVGSEKESAPGQPDEAATTSSAVPNYSVSPRRVAMFAVAVATASVTALAVVSSVEGAEALTTIALVLAIIAFTIQIFLFVMQSQAVSEQRVRSEQLNTQTRALLAEVRSTAEATQAMVSQQFKQLLDAFVTGATQTAQETKFDPVSFEQRMMRNIRAAAQPSGAPVPVGSVQVEARPVTSAPGTIESRWQRQTTERLRERRDRPRRLKSFPPEEEGVKAVATLGSLTPDERNRLRSLASDEIYAEANGAYVGLMANPMADAGLEAKRLVTKARVEVGEGESTVVSRLTDDGVATARVMTAIGDIPDWAREIPSDVETSMVATEDDIPF